MAIKYPKGMRPLIAKYEEQIQKLASRVVHEVTGEPREQQWAASTPPLGAGSWGVVFPLRDERFVVKVTADPTEGPVVASIMAEPALHNHMGIIHYFALRQLPEDVTFRNKTFPVYVVVAERLTDVGGLWKRGMFQGSNNTDDVRTGKQVSNVFDAARAYKKEAEKKRPSEHKLDDLVQDYLDKVGRIDDGPLSDFFFQFYDATKGVLADVHLNNLGKRAVDWEDLTGGKVPLSGDNNYWVISDPGHSSLEEKPVVEALRENPSRREKGEFPYENTRSARTPRGNPSYDDDVGDDGDGWHTEVIK